MVAERVWKLTGWSAAFLVAGLGTYYTYRSYELSERAYLESKAEQAQKQTLAKTDFLIPSAPTAPEVKAETKAQRDHASTASVERTPASPSPAPQILNAEPKPSGLRAAKPNSDPVAKVSLSSRPAPLGEAERSLSAPAKPEEKTPRAAEAPHVFRSEKVTAIEGEAFSLCGESGYIATLWSPQPNAPSRVSLRRDGIVTTDAFSVQFEQGKSKTLLPGCDVTFVEVTPGFRPVAVFEERRQIK